MHCVLETWGFQIIERRVSYEEKDEPEDIS